MAIMVKAGANLAISILSSGSKHHSNKKHQTKQIKNTQPEGTYRVWRQLIETVGTWLGDSQYMKIQALSQWHKEELGKQLREMNTVAELSLRSTNTPSHGVTATRGTIIKALKVLEELSINMLIQIEEWEMENYHARISEYALIIAHLMTMLPMHDTQSITRWGCYPIGPHTERINRGQFDFLGNPLEAHTRLQVETGKTRKAVTEVGGQSISVAWMVTQVSLQGTILLSLQQSLRNQNEWKMWQISNLIRQAAPKMNEGQVDVENLGRFLRAAYTSQEHDKDTHKTWGVHPTSLVLVEGKGWLSLATLDPGTKIMALKGVGESEYTSINKKGVIKLPFTIKDPTRHPVWGLRNTARETYEVKTMIMVTLPAEVEAIPIRIDRPEQRQEKWILEANGTAQVTDEGGRIEQRWERPENRLARYGMLGYQVTQVIPEQNGGSAFSRDTILLGRRVDTYVAGDKIQIGSTKVVTVAAVMVKELYTNWVRINSECVLTADFHVTHRGRTGWAADVVVRDVAAQPPTYQEGIILVITGNNQVWVTIDEDTHINLPTLNTPSGTALTMSRDQEMTANMERDDQPSSIVHNLRKSGWEHTQAYKKKTIGCFGQNAPLTRLREDSPPEDVPISAIREGDIILGYWVPNAHGSGEGKRLTVTEDHRCPIRITFVARKKRMARQTLVGWPTPACTPDHPTWYPEKGWARADQTNNYTSMDILGHLYMIGGKPAHTNPQEPAPERKLGAMSAGTILAFGGTNLETTLVPKYGVYNIDQNITRGILQRGEDEDWGLIGLEDLASQVRERKDQPVETEGYKIGQIEAPTEEKGDPIAEEIEGILTALTPILSERTQQIMEAYERYKDLTDCMETIACNHIESREAAYMQCLTSRKQVIEGAMHAEMIAQQQTQDKPEDYFREISIGSRKVIRALHQDWNDHVRDSYNKAITNNNTWRDQHRELQHEMDRLSFISLTLQLRKPPSLTMGRFREALEKLGRVLCLLDTIRQEQYPDRLDQDPTPWPLRMVMGTHTKPTVGQNKWMAHVSHRDGEHKQTGLRCLAPQTTVLTTKGIQKLSSLRAGQLIGVCYIGMVLYTAMWTRVNAVGTAHQKEVCKYQDGGGQVICTEGHPIKHRHRQYLRGWTTPEKEAGLSKTHAESNIHQIVVGCGPGKPAIRAGRYHVAIMGGGISLDSNIAGEEYYGYTGPQLLNILEENKDQNPWVFQWDLADAEESTLLIHWTTIGKELQGDIIVTGVCDRAEGDVPSHDAPILENDRVEQLTEVVRLMTRAAILAGRGRCRNITVTLMAEKQNWEGIKYDFPGQIRMEGIVKPYPRVHIRRQILKQETTIPTQAHDPKTCHVWVRRSRKPIYAGMLDTSGHESQFRNDWQVHNKHRWVGKAWEGCRQYKDQLEGHPEMDILKDEGYSVHTEYDIEITAKYLHRSKQTRRTTHPNGWYAAKEQELEDHEFVQVSLREGGEEWGSLIQYKTEQLQANGWTEEMLIHKLHEEILEFEQALGDLRAAQVDTRAGSGQDSRESPIPDLIYHILDELGDVLLMIELTQHLDVSTNTHGKVEISTDHATHIVLETGRGREIKETGRTQEDKNIKGTRDTPARARVMDPTRGWRVLENMGPEQNVVGWNQKGKLEVYTIKKVEVIKYSQPRETTGDYIKQAPWGNQPYPMEWKDRQPQTNETLLQLGWARKMMLTGEDNVGIILYDKKEQIIKPAILRAGGAIYEDGGQAPAWGKDVTQQQVWPQIDEPLTNAICRYVHNGQRGRYSPLQACSRGLRALYQYNCMNDNKGNMVSSYEDIRDMQLRKEEKGMLVLVDVLTTPHHNETPQYNDRQMMECLFTGMASHIRQMILTQDNKEEEEGLHDIVRLCLYVSGIKRMARINRLESKDQRADTFNQWIGYKNFKRIWPVNHNVGAVTGRYNGHGDPTAVAAITNLIGHDGGSNIPSRNDRIQWVEEAINDLTILLNKGGYGFDVPCLLMKQIEQLVEIRSDAEIQTADPWLFRPRNEGSHEYKLYDLNAYKRAMSIQEKTITFLVLEEVIIKEKIKGEIGIEYARSGDEIQLQFRDERIYKTITHIREGSLTCEGRGFIKDEYPITGEDRRRMKRRGTQWARSLKDIGYYMIRLGDKKHISHQYTMIAKSKGTGTSIRVGEGGWIRDLHGDGDVNPHPGPQGTAEHKMLEECHETLQIRKGATIAQITDAYKQRALIHHPDKGGSKEAFQNLKRARDELIKYTEKKNKEEGKAQTINTGEEAELPADAIFLPQTILLMNNNEWKPVETLTKEEEVFITKQGQEVGIGAKLRKQIYTKNTGYYATQCEYNAGIHTWRGKQSVGKDGLWGCDSRPLHQKCRHQSVVSLRALINKEQMERLGIQELDQQVAVTVLTKEKGEYQATKVRIAVELDRGINWQTNSQLGRATQNTNIREQIERVEKNTGVKILDTPTTTEDFKKKYGRGAHIYNKHVIDTESHVKGIPYPITIPKRRHQHHGVGWTHNALQGPSDTETKKRRIDCIIQGTDVLVNEGNVDTWKRVETLREGEKLVGAVHQIVGRSDFGIAGHLEPRIMTLTKIEKRYEPGLINTYGPHRNDTTTHADGRVTSTHMIPIEHTSTVTWSKAGEVWLHKGYQEGVNLYRLHVEHAEVESYEPQEITQDVSNVLIAEEKQAVYIKTGVKEARFGDQTMNINRRSLVHVQSQIIDRKQQRREEMTLANETLAQIMIAAETGWYTAENAISAVNTTYRHVQEHKQTYKELLERQKADKALEKQREELEDTTKKHKRIRTPPPTTQKPDY